MLGVWDAHSGELSQFVQSDGLSLTVSWSYDNKLLAFPAAGSVRIWDMEKKREHFRIPFKRLVYGSIWSPNEHVLAPGRAPPQERVPRERVAAHGCG